jgi:cystathionine beta-lyase/cystathionine gamma-synthase
MGSISMNDHGHYETLRETQSILGQQVSPDDCFLVLRGLETLKVRLEAQSASTLQDCAVAATATRRRQTALPTAGIRCRSCALEARLSTPMVACFH